MALTSNFRQNRQKKVALRRFGTCYLLNGQPESGLCVHDFLNLLTQHHSESDRHNYALVITPHLAYLNGCIVGYSL